MWSISLTEVFRQPTDHLPELLLLLVSAALGSVVFGMVCLKAHLASKHSRRRTAIVMVLGDIGRSPRMMYHADSFAKHDWQTEIVAYYGMTTTARSRILVVTYRYSANTFPTGVSVCSSTSYSQSSQTSPQAAMGCSRPFTHRLPNPLGAVHLLDRNTLPLRVPRRSESSFHTDSSSRANHRACYRHKAHH